MTEEKETAVECPFCKKPAILIGNKITCENCDAIYRVTKEGEAKLDKLGPIKELEQRVSALEAGGQEPEPELESISISRKNNEPESESEGEPENEEEESW